MLNPTKNAIRIIYIIAIFSLLACKGNYKLQTQPKTYYISSSNGDDSNDGITPYSPWASLKKINNTILEPGDTIRFKAGDIWNGQLEILYSGRNDSLITIDKYGEGPKPKINGLGEKRFTLLLKNISDCMVRNLEITNTGRKRLPRRTGVLVQAINVGDCSNITLDSLEVHHVNGSLVKREGGGSAIFWENKGDSIPSRFVNLKIQNSHLHHCGRNGITSSGNSGRDNWYPSTGIIIRKNLLEYIPGDCIVPIGTDGTLIEHNTILNCTDVLSHNEAAAGIWPWSSDNTLIQFNKVIGHKAKWDGQAYDSDYNCINTIIQYNYSSNNYGGFALICNNGESLGKPYNTGTKNSIIRNNISIDDGIRPYPTKRKGWFSPLIHITGPVADTEINSNLFIKSSVSLGSTIIEMDNWGGAYPINTNINRNIFYVEQGMRFNFKDDLNTEFSNNYLSDLISKDSYLKFYGDNKVLKNDRDVHLIKMELESSILSKDLIDKWIEYFKG